MKTLICGASGTTVNFQILISGHSSEYSPMRTNQTISSAVKVSVQKLESDVQVDSVKSTAVYVKSNAAAVFSHVHREQANEYFTNGLAQNSE